MTQKLIAVFPGQGSQHTGMTKELYETFKQARETFEEASDACSVNLKKLCFDGPDSDLNLTENTQPCLLTASVAAFRVAVAETGFAPGAVAGHSLGEYSALVAAGVLPLAATVRWVKARGRAMQEAVPAGQGTMAAVLGLADELMDPLCEAAGKAALEKRAKGENSEITVEALVQPANFNAPGQVVIAGSTDAVSEAVFLIKNDPRFKGGKAIPLTVSAPFHCALMRPARDRMAELFALAKELERPKHLTIPYFPNRTARPTRESGLVFEFLVEQVDHPVLWRQSVQAFSDLGLRGAVEFGPGKVLTGLIKRTLGQTKPGAPTSEAFGLMNVSDTAGIRGLEEAKKTPYEETHVTANK
jgi:[acyl-carrier-protein] S-malonyltransferase